MGKIEPIKVGEVYGGFKVIKEAEGYSVKTYTVECIHCGKRLDRITEVIKKNRHGCQSCYQKERQKRWQTDAVGKIGKKYGTLTVLEVYRKAQPNAPKKTNYFARCICECGAKGEYQLSEVEARTIYCRNCGGIKKEKAKNIFERKGVYYLVYSYKKRQYYLGAYNSLTEAEKVRDTAEIIKQEDVFLEWYEKKFKKKDKGG